MNVGGGGGGRGVNLSHLRRAIFPYLLGARTLTAPSRSTQPLLLWYLLATHEMNWHLLVKRDYGTFIDYSTKLIYMKPKTLLWMDGAIILTIFFSHYSLSRFP
jgi:hypothetical protein